MLPISQAWTIPPSFLHQNGSSRRSQVQFDLQAKPSLDGCICLVTGASRGIGKGIAVELGVQGAIVYVTGTTTVEGSAATNATLGTIEQTASEVTSAGGKGIPVVCDHSNDNDVKSLFLRIEKERGRLDILVNNAFRLPDSGAAAIQRKFWEQGPVAWDPIHTVGLRSHYVATCFAVPLMLRQDKSPASIGLSRSLIVMISSFGGISYSFNVAYGVGKAGVDRMAKDMAVDLAGTDISIISLWPGLVNTERTKELVASGEWDEYIKIPLDDAESPRFTGRAVVALATDPQNIEKSGTFQVVAELAQEYGYTDLDGKVPPSIRSLRFLLPAYGFTESQRESIPSSLIPDWKLPFWMMAQGRPPE